jgi:hypothetical protein
MPQAVTEQSMADLRVANAAVRWMGYGVLPSAQVARQGRQALLDFKNSDYADTVDVTHAVRMLGAIGTGLAPSQEHCFAASREIQTAIDTMRDVDSQTLRERFDRMR